MKIQCNRMALHEAIQLASSIVPSRTPKPILQCAMIQCLEKDQPLQIMATDNDITIQVKVSQVQVDRPGKTVIPADRLAAILHESKDETVELELIDSTCQIKGKDSQFKIYGHDPDDYPVMELFEPEQPTVVMGAVLKRMIHMSSFSAAKENTRYAINGVLWEQKGKKLRMVATDGRRLAKVEGAALSASSKEESSAIVSAKMMHLVERVLQDPEEKVQVSFKGNQVGLHTGHVQVLSNLVQGRFPRYEDVIPEGCDKKIQMNTEVLHSGIRRAALLTNEQSKGILMSFSKGALTLTSSAPEAGEAEIRMDVGCENKGEFSIGFNPQYILEALRVIEEPEIAFEMIDGNKPALIRAGKDFVYVLMPVTI